MTKKDYVLIASTLRFYNLRVSMSQDEYAKDTIKNLISDFVYNLESENSRFDRDKFLQACGLQWDGTTR